MAKVKQVLNISEKSLEIKLNKALIGSNRRVFPSVALGNVLDIKRTELQKAEFDLALKTSFDFIITDSDTTPLFAIEFDGPVHQRGIKQQIDRTKNSICEKYGFPILRIDHDLLNAQIENVDLVEWLVELHFIYDEFCKKQERGEIPADEPFYFGLIIDFDPFIKYRANIQRWAKEGLIKSGIPYNIITAPGDNYYYSLTAIEFMDDLWIYGEAKCRIFLFPAISPAELSEELSIIAVANNIRKRLFGMDTEFLTTEDLLKRRKRLEAQVVRESGRKI